MKVRGNYLLLVASLVWSIAGFNILKIGFESYIGNYSPINIILSIIIFLLFWLNVFKKLIKKHTERIKGYNNAKTLFIKFFDKKSFMIMLVMMTVGILIRKLNLWTTLWIAVFYAGLGTALILSGLLFLYNFIKIKLIKNKK